jgi:hypothetical protein
MAVQYNKAAFIATPKSWRAHLSTANTNFDGTGTIVSVCAAGSNGTEIYALTAQALVTTTAACLNFFIYDGANYRLALQLPTTAVTAGAGGTAGVAASLRADGSPILTLNSGDTLYASTYNSEAWDVFAEGGDL